MSDEARRSAPCTSGPLRRWSWWLLAGVAHETARMVYERPMVRLGRSYRHLCDAFDALRSATRTAANDFRRGASERAK